MKFTHINVHNVHELIPPWAIDPFILSKHLDGLFLTESGARLAPTGAALYQPLPFWVEVNVNTTPQTVRVCTPDNSVNLSGRLILICRSVANELAQIDVPLNPIFKGYDRIEGKYSVYLHSFQTETPIGYVGMTKQRWFNRYAQHISSARTGSPYLFHRAIREHQGCEILHKVFVCELDHSNALECEEEWVGMFGLYPLGLNMIPGGKAGFAYLSKLGLQAKTSEERDASLERLSACESLEGRTNPLCAARWESDPSFAERVICGHSSRLSVAQIQLIRLGASFGKSVEQLTLESAALNSRQVKNLVSGRTYQRIK
ncbi:MAG: hypothetical protein U1E04_17480 [Hylemonella sp.]|nr:hypothetical protein [Hylemonella sp.]